MMVAAAGVSAAGAPRRAYADDLTVHVSVKRAPDASDCPDAAHLAAAIARAGHRAQPAIGPNADQRLRFEVAMEKSATGYVAKVDILGARIGVREINHTGGTCAPLGDALAVALVVVIDDVKDADATPRPPDPTPPPSSTQPADETGPPPPPPPPPLPVHDRPETRTASPPEAELQTFPTRTANNSLFFEFGGAGLFYTFNYERIFGDSGVSLRVGFGYVHLDGTIFDHSFNEEDISLPAVASYYIGDGSHKVQIGAGALLLYQQYDGPSEGTATTINFTGILGYRYLPAEGGMNFGISFTPCFRPDVTLPWAGIDFGAGF